MCWERGPKQSGQCEHITFTTTPMAKRSGASQGEAGRTSGFFRLYRRLAGGNFTQSPLLLHSRVIDYTQHVNCFVDVREKKMKVSTGEFIKLIQERPALWQKSHPDFANRDVRNELLAQIALVADIDASECAKKMKNLKDSMRAQVKKLPKTNSGAPDFSLTDHITWPFFKRLLFMRDEFIGRKTASNLKYEDTVASETSDVEEDFIQDCEPEIHVDLSDIQGASSNILTMPNWDPCDGYSGNVKRLRPNPDQFDYEERQLMVRTDELDTFVSDIANDLRKIKCPLKLMQAKSKIRRIAEEFVMSELLPSVLSTPGTSSVPPSPSQ